MGCCENSRIFLGYQNKKSSSSSSLNALKETNLSNEIKKDSPIYIDKVLKKLLRNKTPKLYLNKYKKYKVLDKINEEESESKESSANNQKYFLKEKIVENLKIKKEKLKTQNIKLEKIKTLRKNRSHPKFKIKLNEEMFIKKLNEYKENSKNTKTKETTYYNYISQLSRCKESKSEKLYDKTGEASLRDTINKINKEYKNTKINKNKRKNNIFIPKKEKENKTQYYEEEINKYSIQHVPKSFSKIILKKSILSQDSKISI